MHTAAPRCAHTPGIYAIHMYTHIYIFMELYTFILACSACTLPAQGRLAPCSIITLQEYFHRSLGLSSVISCAHRMKSPAVGHLDP